LTTSSNPINLRIVQALRSRRLQRNCGVVKGKWQGRSPRTSAKPNQGKEVAESACAREAAAELNLSKATIRAWIGQRRLGHVRLGRAIRIPAKEIQRVLEVGYVPPERGR
jgi:excisionase family DNA binding protein